MGRSLLVSFALFVGLGWASASRAEHCVSMLQPRPGYEMAVYIINPDGTEEGPGDSKGPTEEEKERERRERDEYWRKRQPQIVPVPRWEPPRGKPIPGVDLPLPNSPHKRPDPKKDLPN